MNKLIVINYDGDRFKSDNHSNLKLNFYRDSGLEPSLILDQLSRSELLSFLSYYSERADYLIIHIKSHGGEAGIAKEHPEIENCGAKESFISWEELINVLNRISENCRDLIVNLGTVCNSININKFDVPKNFTTLVTNQSVTDPVKPRKLNKWLIGKINNIKLCPQYELLIKE